MIQQLGLNRTDNFLDTVQQHPTINQLITPNKKIHLKKNGFNLRLINMRKISAERNLIAHIRIQSIDDQIFFMTELTKQNLPVGYEHSATIQQIVSCLLSLNMDPSNIRLHAID